MFYLHLHAAGSDSMWLWLEEGASNNFCVVCFYAKIRGGGEEEE